MFRPDDLKRVPGLLTRCAGSSGAQLVQSIRHETSACYFVLARSQGKHVAHLAVDCYGDYRRDDRTWLLAEDMVAHRRRYRDFNRPSVADEFIYRLIKKVLKQSLSAHTLRRLRHLFARDAEACRDRLARLWPAATAIPLERNMLDQNHRWFREHLAALLAELQRSPHPHGRIARLGEGVGNAARLLKRVLFPTGLYLSVLSGASGSERIADRLLCSLAPAFRHAAKLPVPVSLFESLVRGIRIRIAKIRSTLVIEEIDRDATTSARKPFSRFLIHLFARPDLYLHLNSDGLSANERASRGAVNRICLDPSLHSEHLAEQANIAILNWLADRTARRLKVVAAPPVRSNAEPTVPTRECEFVGSD